jgi:hypothetical protein
VDGTLAVLLSEGPPGAPAESLLLLFDADTGRRKGRVALRYEARRLAVDTNRGLILAGNGGDGSVSVVDSSTGRLQTTLDVANAAEGVAIDPSTGTRFVLNRLGGSEIYRWDDSGLKPWAEAPWPFELALDPQRRMLLAAAHFDGKLHRWALDDGSNLGAVNLGLSASTGDAIGDMVYDTRTGQAAVVLPESGGVALASADGDSLWSTTLEDLKAGANAGPGHGLIALAPDRVFVSGGRPPRIFVLDRSTGATVLTGQPLQPGAGVSTPSRKTGYRLNTLLYDATGERLFLGGTVLDPETLQVRQVLDGVHKVIHVDERQVVAMAAESTGEEHVLLLDPDSLQVVDRQLVTHTSGIRTEANYAPSTGRLYLSDLPSAQVRVLQLPRDTDTRGR